MQNFYLNSINITNYIAPYGYNCTIERMWKIMQDKNTKKINISASTHDNDALEDVSGGYQIITIPKPNDPA